MHFSPVLICWTDWLLFQSWMLCDIFDKTQYIDNILLWYDNMARNFLKDYRLLWDLGHNFISSLHRVESIRSSPLESLGNILGLDGKMVTWLKCKTWKRIIKKTSRLPESGSQDVFFLLESRFVLERQKSGPLIASNLNLSWREQFYTYLADSLIHCWL